jgi:predicted small lipoprotein YifL
MHPRMMLGLGLAAVLIGTLALSACGVRGSLEAPAAAKTETGDATPGKPGEPVPKKGFILDPLLR